MRPRRKHSRSAHRHPRAPGPADTFSPFCPVNGNGRLVTPPSCWTHLKHWVARDTVYNNGYAGGEERLKMPNQVYQAAECKFVWDILLHAYGWWICMHIYSLNYCVGIICCTSTSQRPVHIPLYAHMCPHTHHTHGKAWITYTNLQPCQFTRWVATRQHSNCK